MEESEPSRNIAGGDGERRPEGFTPSGDPATRAEAVVDRLGRHYWRKTYGGQDAFTCLVRTILSQNTTDRTSQPAFDALMERYGNPDGGADSGGEAGVDLAVRLADVPEENLAETIAPAGLQHQKADVIRRVAERIRREYAPDTSDDRKQTDVDELGGPAARFDQFVRAAPAEDVRETLLDMHGVGPKTADCVLLFAGGRSGVFPVDTHVHRIYRRLGVTPPAANHEAIRAVLERDVPPEKCGFGHTASIQFGREYCTARNPACLDGADACPLYDLCDRVGVSPETGEVVDPADTVE